ncbi:MAG: hypothetical protein OEX02_14225 [Cyclobacteriaceae bacterium]|nr:hypothetical protein [Cyclobacteriaceae bacterium]
MDSYAQTKIGVPQLILGGSYRMFDYEGGITFGLSFNLWESPLGLNIRRDHVILIERAPPLLHPNPYVIAQYGNRIYFDLSYELNDKFIMGLGYGWSHYDHGEYALFNRQSGFNLITLYGTYKFHWLYMETRVDVPLESWGNSNLNSPLTFSLYSIIVPKGNKTAIE